MAFKPGDIIRSVTTRRLGKVVSVMPSGRVDVYMLGVGSFVPYSKPEQWELAERADPQADETTRLHTGQIIMDRDLIVVIQRQAEMIGGYLAAIAQIQWMARNYIIRNIKTTEHELRRVLRDIDQTTITVKTGGSLSFNLIGSYEDSQNNPFPPTSTDAGSGITQEG